MDRIGGQATVAIKNEEASSTPVDKADAELWLGEEFRFK